MQDVFTGSPGKETFIMNSPKQIAESYIETGAAKAEMPKLRMFLLAIFAGAFIAFAGVAATVGTALLGKIVGAAIFPAGLAMVVVFGSELFTGNNLMIISALEKRISVQQLLMAWLIVWLGNLAGSLFVAVFSVIDGSFDAVYETLVATATAKVSLSFGTAVIRAMLCNILVCVAVWMTMAAKDAAGKIICLYLPIMTFVVCGYEHSIANMFYIPAGLLAAARYGITAEGLTWGACFLKNLLPVTLGNMIGGVGLGALLHAIYLPARKTETV